ncbi:hypothetical protein JXA88_17310 [Candidatus Fermentibacteria bacterium]|nr:hypothetical protein [Candidatus Fermentibacteria bacterium]
MVVHWGNRFLSRRDAVWVLVVAGSLWGLSEVVLDAALRAFLPQVRAGVLVGVGMLLMGVVTGLGVRPMLLLAAASIAVACRQLAVPMLGASILCKANASLAVMLQACALVGVASVFGQRMHERSLIRGIAAATAALSAAGAFWVIGLRVAPCAYLMSFGRPGGFPAFLGREGLLWAAMSGLAMPVGYRWGQRVAEGAEAIRAEKSGLVYAASAVLTLSCWVMVCVATAYGY